MRKNPRADVPPRDQPGRPSACQARWRCIAMTRADVRAAYDATVTENPRARHAVVQGMVAGPFVVEHAQLIGMADGRVRNGLDILRVANGHVVGEWENEDV